MTDQVKIQPLPWDESRVLNEPFEPGQSRRLHNYYFFVLFWGFFSAHLIKQFAALRSPRVSVTQSCMSLNRCHQQLVHKFTTTLNWSLFPPDPT